MDYPNGIDIAAWKYLAVVVPIIVFFAPLGSLLSSYFHRQVLAALVYVLDTVALVSSYHLKKRNYSSLVLTSLVVNPNNPQHPQ